MFGLLTFSVLFFLASGSKTNEKAEANLKKTIASIKSSCGQVCDTTIKGIPGKYFDQLSKTVDCPALFKNEDIDKPMEYKIPPHRIPSWLRDDFTYHGLVDVERYYLDDKVKKPSPNNYHFTKARAKQLNENMDSGFKTGPYTENDRKRINEFIGEYLNVTGKQVLVVGTAVPWIEIFALRHGAKHVTTLEHNAIYNEIPDITTMTPNEFSRAFLNGELPEFDAVISFSSFEHFGLGRYGDNLNPWGDLIGMARVWCTLKKGGKALIGIPVGPKKDVIWFNAHRAYGPLMLSHLFANFKQVISDLRYFEYNPSCVYCYQPLFVVEK